MSPGLLHYKTVLVVKRKQKWLMISKLFNYGRDSIGSDLGVAYRKRN